MANRRRAVCVPRFGRPQPGYHIRETVSLAISRTDQKERGQSISGQNHEPAQMQYTYSKQPSQPKHKSKKVVRWIVFSIIVAIVLLYLVLKYFIN